MASPKIINKFGILTGWGAVTSNVLGRDLEGIDEIEYSDEMPSEMAYGAGLYPIGVEIKNYSAKASFSLLFEENVALLRSLPPGTRIQQIPPFDVPVVYEHNGLLYKDIIRNCRFTTNGRSVKNGDGKIMFKYELSPTHIDWDVR